MSAFRPIVSAIRAQADIVRDALADRSWHTPEVPVTGIYFRYVPMTGPQTRAEIHLDMTLTGHLRVHLEEFLVI